MKSRKTLWKSENWLRKEKSLQKKNWKKEESIKKLKITNYEGEKRKKEKNKE